MNEIQVFAHPEFGNVSTVIIDGKEHFEATPCAKALGYVNPHDAILRHCKGLVKHETLTTGGKQAVNFIPEGDLYRLIVNSKLPDAAKFERWVFDEVLPSIRKTGGYSVKQLTDDELILAAVTKLQTRVACLAQTVTAQQKKIELDKPKVDFANQVGDCENGKGIREFGLVFKQNGAGFGQNGLVKRLLRDKYIYRDPKSKLRPYSEHTTDSGLFWTKTVVIDSPEGTFETVQVLVTGKGQQFFLNKYMPLSAEVGGALTVPDPYGNEDVKIPELPGIRQTNTIPAVHFQNEPLEY